MIIRRVLCKRLVNKNKFDVTIYAVNKLIFAFFTYQKFSWDPNPRTLSTIGSLS